MCYSKVLIACQCRCHDLMNYWLMHVQVTTLWSEKWQISLCERDSVIWAKYKLNYFLWGPITQKAKEFIKLVSFNINGGGAVTIKLSFQFLINKLWNLCQPWSVKVCFYVIFWMAVLSYLYILVHLVAIKQVYFHVEFIGQMEDYFQKFHLSFFIYQVFQQRQKYQYIRHILQMQLSFFMPIWYKAYNKTVK